MLKAFTVTEFWKLLLDCIKICSFLSPHFTLHWRLSCSACVGIYVCKKFSLEVFLFWLLNNAVTLKRGTIGYVKVVHIRSWNVCISCDMAQSVSYSSSRLRIIFYGDNVIENKWKWNYMMVELNGYFFFVCWFLLCLFTVFCNFPYEY